MPLKFKRKTRKPTRKIVRKSYRKPKSNLIKLIKSVSLKNIETKNTHSIAENLQMNHNMPTFRFAFLRTSQGLGDDDTGANFFAGRVGDEIIARGISIKLWIANKLDRPNVMYRVIVFKYESSITPTTALIFTGANPNKMMDNVNKEVVSVVYQKIFNLQVAYSGAITPTDFEGKEAHTYRKIWIPLKNKKVHYSNGGQVPKFNDYGMCITAYDSYGTLTTDNIASYAFEYNMYYKDA